MGVPEAPPKKWGKEKMPVGDVERRFVAQGAAQPHVGTAAVPAEPQVPECSL